MRAGMFAELQPIPGPERPILVVVRDRVNLTGGVFLPISGGSLIKGVSGPSGAVRSTTSTAPDASADAKSLRT